MSLTKNAIAFTMLADGIPIGESILNVGVKSSANKDKSTTAKNKITTEVRYHTIEKPSGSPAIPQPQHSTHSSLP